MLHKSRVLLCSYNKSVEVFSLHQTLPSPSLSRQEVHKHPRRKFATVRDKIPCQDEIQWPQLKSTAAVPTPYQIFQQKKNAPYSKRRFYELVKLYHPDRHFHTHDSLGKGSLSHATKIERYRLVVAANDILADPTKRKAYDEYGAGWNGRPDAGARKQEWANYEGGHWSGFQDNSSPARNATWEDWEKWYQRNDKGERVHQQTVYFSNEGFLSLIAIIACLGGIGQATRIGDQNKSYLKRMETTHTDCSQDTQRRMEEAQGYGTKDKRVQGFLRTREQSGFPTTDLGEDHYKKLAPPPSTT